MLFRNFQKFALAPSAIFSSPSSSGLLKPSIFCSQLFRLYSEGGGAETASKIKKGDYILLKNAVCQVTEISVGGKARSCRTVTFNYRTLPGFSSGSTRFTSTDDVPLADVGTISCQVMYETDDAFHCISTKHEEIEVPKSVVPEDVRPYIHEQMVLKLVKNNGNSEVLAASIPESISARVEGIHEEGGSGRKCVYILNGIKLVCPSHVNIGDYVIVNTKEHRFSAKVSKEEFETHHSKLLMSTG